MNTKDKLNKETPRGLLIDLVAEWDRYLSWVEDSNDKIKSGTLEEEHIVLKSPSKESFARWIYREWVEVPLYPEEYKNEKKWLQGEEINDKYEENRP